jgi:phosphatidylserine/phosphatidylglycerophosphate/cardiolipin synthase-like enzyme
MSARESLNSVFDDSLAATGLKQPLEQIQSTGLVAEVVIGNGLITTQYLTDLLVQAKEEVLFSTCFWAPSPSLSVLHDALITLNNRARDYQRRVTVQILFSSYSFRQKFLSIKGVRKWKSNTWEKLGLPSPSSLDYLDMTVLSRFRKPFGVMHAKFLIIDRAVVVLPSSNISCNFCLGFSSYNRGKLVRACRST